MEKKKYTQPCVDVLQCDCMDIVTASGPENVEFGDVQSDFFSIG